MLRKTLKSRDISQETMKTKVMMKLKIISPMRLLMLTPQRKRLHQMMAALLMASKRVNRASKTPIKITITTCAKTALSFQQSSATFWISTSKNYAAFPLLTWMSTPALSVANTIKAVDATHTRTCILSKPTITCTLTCTMQKSTVFRITTKSLISL